MDGKKPVQQVLHDACPTFRKVALQWAVEKRGTGTNAAKPLVPVASYMRRIGASPLFSTRVSKLRNFKTRERGILATLSLAYAWHLLFGQSGAVQLGHHTRAAVSLGKDRAAKFPANKTRAGPEKQVWDL